MAEQIPDHAASIARENEKLRKINDVLIRRIEHSDDSTGAAYAQFRRAATLEEEVRRRTQELEQALDLLNSSNAQLSDAHRATEAARSNLANAIEAIQEGFAFFDPSDKLIMFNSRFGLHMPDVRRGIKEGLDFVDYVTLVSQSPDLALGDKDTPAAWAERRMARHREDHVIFNARIVGDRWVQVSEHRTPDGGTVIIQTDVTDIMRLERAERDRILDDQSRTIQATLEHLNQGVCIFDAKARLVGWNRRVGDLLSLPARILRIGTTFDTWFESLISGAELVAGPDADDIRTWAHAKMGRGGIEFELQMGTRRTLTVDAQDIPENGFVISVSDVTSERAAVRAIREVNELLEARVAERTLELEDALSEAERANTSKSRFVAAASHDLLQPLSAAKLYLSSIEAADLPAAAETTFEKAGRALASVEHILEALLDISKLDSGKASLQFAPIRLETILRQLHDEFTPVARQKGLELRVVTTRAVVVSDPTYLRRILQNLISNAIRYTTSGKVVVGTRRRGASVRVEVWDSGPGIPESERDAIFNEFRRIETAASAAEGMGLGLAIVDRACALLNHPLELVSAMGRGTGFLITMPRARSDAHSAPQPHDRPSVDRSDLSNFIILLIENDKEVRDALAVALERRWGAGVITAAGTNEAIAAIDEIGLPPDAVFADYQLDNGDTGLRAVEEIRERHGPVPACIISADRTSELVNACQQMRLDLFHKPVEFAEISEFLFAVARGEVKAAP